MDQSGSIRAAMSVYGRPSRHLEPASRVGSATRRLPRRPEDGGKGGVWVRISGLFGVRPEEPGGERGDEGGHGAPGPLSVSKLNLFGALRDAR